MPKIIVTPSEQKHFADFLENRTRMLLDKKRKFMDMLAAARTVCQDQKYAAFRARTEETASALEEFRNISDRYVEFLRRKANAGERYLRG